MTNKLLRLCSTARKFEDNFNTSYTPSGTSPLTLSNFYNNWNYKGKYYNSGAGMGYPYFDGSQFRGYAGGGQYSAQINRNKENYILSRAMDIKYSFKHQTNVTGGDYQNGMHQVSIGGDTSALIPYLATYPTNSVPDYSGITVWGFSTWDIPGGGYYAVRLKIANNKTNIATVGDFAGNTWWDMYLKLRGNTLYYSCVATGNTPSYSSVSITDKTVDSNSLIMAMASSNAQDYGAVPVYFDNLSILLL